MTIVLIDLGYGVHLQELLEDYVATEISTYNSRGTLEELQDKNASLVERFGRLVQILYSKGTLDVTNIKQIVGDDEFRGEITMKEEAK